MSTKPEGDLISPKILLSIAGFDPSSGAGITADLATFAAHGHFGTSAITALTVQSTLGVRHLQPAGHALLADTLACLAEDLPPAGIKIGMLATEENVAAVVDFLASRSPHVPAVLDPVLRSTSGRELLSPAGADLLRSELLPLVDWVTPNWSELALLAGQPVQDAHSAEQAAATLQGDAKLNVVVTGGDGEPADDLILIAGEAPLWLRGRKIPSSSTHGTGCAFSSALLCALVDGLAPVEAASRAKLFVAEAIRSATPLGHGHGPLNLLWPLRPPSPAGNESS